MKITPHGLLFRFHMLEPMLDHKFNIFSYISYSYTEGFIIISFPARSQHLFSNSNMSCISTYNLSQL